MLPRIAARSVPAPCAFSGESRTQPETRIVHTRRKSRESPPQRTRHAAGAGNGYDGDPRTRAGSGRDAYPGGQRPRRAAQAQAGSARGPAVCFGEPQGCAGTVPCGAYRPAQPGLLCRGFSVRRAFADVLAGDISTGRLGREAGLIARLGNEGNEPTDPSDANCGHDLLSRATILCYATIQLERGLSEWRGTLWRR